MGTANKIQMCDWNALHDEIYNLYQSETSKFKCFHYTTPEAVLSIFSEYISNGCGNNVISCDMRASHLRFLNDAQEYKDGVEWISKNLKIDNNEIYDQIYSISFCGFGDLLSQWKWYGKNSGVSIEFDMDNIKYEYWDCKVSELPCADEQTKPLLIRYTDDEKMCYYKYIKELNEKRRLNRNSEKLIRNLMIPYSKDKGFSEEKESRLVFYTFNGRDFGIDFKIRYYNSNGVIKPTLDVKFSAIDSKKNIIKTLIVGPGKNQNLVFNALVHIFDHNSFCFDDSSNEHLCSNGVTILKSAIPFRG